MMMFALHTTWFQKVRLESANRAKMVDGVFQGFKKMGLDVPPGMPFPEFAELICGVPDDRTEKHLRSQSSSIVRDGRVIAEFVGRIERMGEDWSKVMERAGLDFELPHLNRTSHEHYSSYFPDEALVKRVAERYREDVERFEYTFERR